MMRQNNIRNRQRSTPCDSSWGASPVPRITQAEIADLKHRRRLALRLSRECNQLRASIRERLEDDATVEPGRYHVRIKEQVNRTLSAAKLTALYGVEFVQGARAAVEPTIQRSVVIDDLFDDDDFA